MAEDAASNTVSMQFELVHRLGEHEVAIVIGDADELGAFDLTKGVRMENAGSENPHLYQAKVVIDLKEKTQKNVSYNFAKFDTRIPDKITVMKHDVGDNLMVCLKLGGTPKAMKLQSTWIIGMRRNGSSGTFNGKMMEGDSRHSFAPGR